MEMRRSVSEACLAILERFTPGTSDAVARGSASGCAFCKARFNKSAPLQGEILLLNGFDAGQRGEVIESGDDWVTIVCRMENGTARFVDPFLSLFSIVPLPAKPSWFPPLDIRDAFIVDEAVVWFLDQCQPDRKAFEWSAVGFDEVIRTCWERRIPILPSEIVAVLTAHGLPHSFAERANCAYENGLRLLVHTHRRSPIKSRRLMRVKKADRPSWF